MRNRSEGAHQTSSNLDGNHLLVNALRYAYHLEIGCPAHNLVPQLCDAALLCVDRMDTLNYLRTRLWFAEPVKVRCQQSAGAGVMHICSSALLLAKASGGCVTSQDV